MLKKKMSVIWIVYVKIDAHADSLLQYIKMKQEWMD